MSDPMSAALLERQITQAREAWEVASATALMWSQRLDDLRDRFDRVRAQMALATAHADDATATWSTDAWGGVSVHCTACDWRVLHRVAHADIEPAVALHLDAHRYGQRVRVTERALRWAGATGTVIGLGPGARRYGDELRVLIDGQDRADLIPRRHTEEMAE